MTTLAADWGSLLAVVFGSESEVPRDNTKVEELIELNERLLRPSEAGPFILPVVIKKTTTYLAIAMSADQNRDLLRLLHACVGQTYTTLGTFDPESEFFETQAFQAAVRFAGRREWVTTFEVVVAGLTDGNDAKKAVQSQVESVLKFSLHRPDRSLRTVAPIGKVLREFDVAVEHGDRNTALHILNTRLTGTGHFSRANKLFLRIRYLAAFEDWEELDGLVSAEPLAQTRRPALVSDALAKLALSGHARNAADPYASFDEHVAPRFGCLIETVDQIRSVHGAEYFVLWNLSAGATSTAIARLLEGYRWAEEPNVLRHLSFENEQPSHSVSTSELTVEVRDAVEQGQFDYALQLLQQTEPIADLVPAVVVITRRLLTAEAMALLSDYRNRIGTKEVDGEVARFGSLEIGVADQPSSPTDAQSEDTSTIRLSWAERVTAVARGDKSGSSLIREAQEDNVHDLIVENDEMPALVAALEQNMEAASARDVLDALAILLSRLRDQLPDSEQAKLGALQWAVLRLWGLGDDSGDLARARRILEISDSILASGCSVAEYEEMVDTYDLRWAPFLTDVGFSVGVRAVELLAGARPAQDDKLLNFAIRILGRVQPANLPRLERVDVLVAAALSDELDLELNFGLLLEPPGEESDQRTYEGTVVGLYSLDENALRRAADILFKELPGVDVRTAADKVSSDRLRSMAQNSDVMVVATAVAAHAATDAISDARGDRDSTYAAGKGSSSLVSAALEAVAALLGPA